MYSIDINLLRDRPGYSDAPVAARGQSESQLPLFLGIGAGVSLVGLVLVAFGVVTFLNQGLAQRQQELETELARIAPNLKKIDQLKAEEKQIEAETQALATVFNQIKPWSVLMQDLRDRTPPTLQITEVEQVSPKPVKAAASAKADPNTPPPPPPKTSDLKISGSALSFGVINDFILALKNSPFLTPENTRLVDSKREKDNRSGVTLVQYEIETTVNDIPSSELLAEIKRKGALGLVTRIETLKQKGVVQP